MKREPKPARRIEETAVARMILIEIVSDGSGKVTRRVEVEGNERAKQYANAIGSALEAAVRAAMKLEVRDG